MRKTISGTNKTKVSLRQKSEYVRATFKAHHTHIFFSNKNGESGET